MPPFAQRTTAVCNIDYNVAFSHERVRTALSQLKRFKSTGSDGVHPYVLRECSDDLANTMSILFKKSFKLGVVPSSWKEANVTPIFKKGDKTIAANYRQVSLLSVPLKIMERLIRDEMLHHLNKNNLLSTAQHGFVSFKSCVTNLLETMDVITEALNREFCAVIAMLDFAKAFDSVPREELLF